MAFSRIFLTLFAVKKGVANQRALAVWLGQSEPSTSRMVGLLAGEGLLDVRRIPGAGNSRHLGLTSAGAALVERGGRLLEARFEELLERSGVSRSSYQRLCFFRVRRRRISSHRGRWRCSIPAAIL